MSTATLERPKTVKKKKSVATPLPVSKIPVNKAKAKKDAFSTDSIAPEHQGDFDFPAGDEEMPEMPSNIIRTEEELTKEHAENIKFGEEPVMIRLAEATEEYGAESIPCWNQGIGAEIFDTRTRKWYPTTALPRGVPVITRRKYAEIIFRSKITEVKTLILQTPGEEPKNRLNRRTVQKFPFEILRDPSPRAQEWREAMSRLRA